MIAIYLNVLETDEQKSLFELLYYEMRDLMFARANSILRDEHLAEDAVHSAFVRVANSFETIVRKFLKKEERDTIIRTKKFRETCPKIEGYMVVIVRNVCIDMINRTSRGGEFYTDDSYLLDVNYDAEQKTADEEYISGEAVDRIVEAIRTLGETLSETLYMHIVMEMDAREISKVLDINYETVRKRIQRGIRELRKQLEA